MKRGPENCSQSPFPDPLMDPVETVVKSPEGRLVAKELIAVVSAAEQLSNGVPPQDVKRNTELIFKQKSTRGAIGKALQGAREIFNNGTTGQKPPSETK